MWGGTRAPIPGMAPVYLVVYSFLGDGQHSSIETAFGQYFYTADESQGTFPQTTDYLKCN